MVERTKDVDMRNGYKVYDSDTYIRPGADTLEKYLSARVRELVPDLESRKVPIRGARLALSSPRPTRGSSASGAVTPSAAGAPTFHARSARRSRAHNARAYGRFMGSRSGAYTATTGMWTDASATWTRRVLTSSYSSILADRAGTRTVQSTSSSCGHSIASWTTSVANIRTGSSR